MSRYKEYYPIKQEQKEKIVSHALMIANLISQSQGTGRQLSALQDAAARLRAVVEREGASNPEDAIALRAAEVQEEMFKQKLEAINGPLNEYEGGAKAMLEMLAGALIVMFIDRVVAGEVQPFDLIDTKGVELSQALKEHVLESFNLKEVVGEES